VRVVKRGTGHMPSRLAQRPDVAGKPWRASPRGYWGLRALAAGLALCSLAPPAFAQQQATGDVARQRAAETFRQGVEAFDRRDFETARVAFLQTLALRPSEAAVQRNLGLSEIYSGHYLDGARRLARVLQTTSQGSSEERSRMQESLKKAETHLQRLTVEVDVDGAEIVVEGTELGRSPLPFAWYLPPGPYDLSVSKPGYRSSTHAGVAQAGKADHVRVVLEPIRAEVPPPVVPAAPAPVEPDVPPTHRRAVSSWLIAGGVVLSAAGLATGVTFSVLANQNEDDADRLRAELESGGQNCDPEGDPAPECATIGHALEKHDRQVKYALVGYAAGASLALLTVVYGLWLAPEETVQAKAPGKSRAQLLPAVVVVDRHRAAVVLSTEF
jgi:PEGA domain-containing protein